MPPKNKIEFRPIELGDKEIFDKFRGINFYNDYFGSELSFLTLYAWKNLYKTKICLTENYLLLSDDREELIFLPPLAKSPKYFLEAFRALISYANENNITFKMSGLSIRQKELLSEFDFLWEEKTDLSEYIYNSADLSKLIGKKYHQKRNHVNKFIKNYSYQYLPYEDKFWPLILSIISNWSLKKGYDFETEAIKCVLKNLSELNAFCDCLFVKDELAGFAIGTVENNNFGLVAFEKCDIKFEGAYQAINMFFAQTHFANVNYINRQEDLGIPELRKAKMSYYPAFLAEKFRIVLKK